MGLRSRISVINSFIKHPDDIVFSISNWEKLKYLIAAIAYDFGIAFLFIIIMNALSPVLEPYENLLNAESYTIWVSIFIICIFTPFLEETIFRLPLKYERNFLFRGISYLLKKDLSIFWKKNLRIIVYIFAATFGFVHLGNYTNTDSSKTRQRQSKFASTALTMKPSKHSWNCMIKWMLISKCLLMRFLLKTFILTPKTSPDIIGEGKNLPPL